jgi:DHA1 family bicyclomycin/chloramphenicol resistance-like MFS transporter
MVAPSAVVRDLFPVEQSARVFSMLILILGVSPILAPTFGGYMVAAWGWKPIFFVLAIITAIILTIVVFFLPESKKADPNYSLKPAAILGNFKEVLKQKQFTTYAISGNFVSAALFAYLAGSPFVFMELHGVHQQTYGWIFALIAAGLITSSQINNLLLRKYKSDRILRTVITIQASLGILMWIGSATHLFNLYGLIAIMMLFLSCQGFIFPNAAAMAMAPFTKHAGSAAALMGAFQMAMGAIASALVGVFFNETIMPMVTVMLVFCMTGFTLLIIGQNRLKKLNVATA